jgi:hypothetical protein
MGGGHQKVRTVSLHGEGAFRATLLAAASGKKSRIPRFCCRLCGGDNKSNRSETGKKNLAELLRFFGRGAGESGCRQRFSAERR